MQHRIENLCYQLIAGSVCLEPLRVLACRSFLWNGWRVAFHILGASHAVTLEREGRCLTELLTCAPQTTAAPVLAQSGCAVASLLCPDVPDFLCRIKLEPFSLTEGDNLQRPVTAANSLTIAFPDVGEPTLPVTRIGWWTEKNILHIESVHTYPEEQHGVRSTTLLTALTETSHLSDLFRTETSRRYVEIT